MKQYISKQNRALLSELVRTDFKLRYQGSAIGYLWSLLKPLLMFAILYVVFVKFLRIGGDIEHFPIYLLLGIVIWSFFSEMTSQSTSSIVARGDLIRKINIPRWMIVASASVSALINLGLNLIVISIFMIFDQVDITWRILLLPVSLVEVYVFALGMSLLLSAAFVKYRDLSNIWEVILQAGFYITPIIYPLSIIKNEFYQQLLLLNPMAQAIQSARYNAVSQDVITAQSILPLPWLFIPFMIVFVAFVGGVIYFKKESKYFAENL